LLFRILSLLFIFLSFVVFLIATIVRFFHPEFVHHDPLTLFKLAEYFLLASIALMIHSRSGKKN
jgi:hypothetical protein